MSIFNVERDAVPVGLLGNQSTTLTVVSGDTLYYADNSQVSPTNNQGSLTAGGLSATFTNNVWIISASASSVSQSFTAASSGGSAAVALPTRRVIHSLASDASATITAYTDLLLRMLVKLPVSTTRWRLRISNQGNAGAITPTDVYMGTPSYNASGGWAGVCTGALTDVLAGLTLPSDGTEYTTPWVTAAGSQFTAYNAQVLSLGFTPASVFAISGTGSIPRAYLFYKTSGTGASSQVGVAAPTGTLTTTGAVMDVRLEYEAVTGALVVLCVGDSTTAGSQDAVGANVASSANGWPESAGLAQGFLPINAGVGATKTADWASAAYNGYTRVAAWNDGDLGTAVAIPDAAVISLGLNDINTPVSLSTFQANYESIIANLRAIGINRIYCTTVTPRGASKAGVLMAGAAVGATTLQTSVPYANLDSLAIDFDTPAGGETVAVSGASTGTQAPFTTTVGATAQAHRQGASIGIAGREDLRWTMNQWLRTPPAGIAGVFDFDFAVREPGSPNQGDVRVYSYNPPNTTYLHPGYGYQRIAGQVRIAH